MKDIQNPELWERWQRAADLVDGEHSCGIDWWIPVGDIVCESPIERRLMKHLLPYAEQHGFTVIAQFKIDPYRYDFAILRDDDVVALVECDGTEFHSTPEQQARDAAKDLLAKQSGFVMFRYSGRDIHRNAWTCVQEIISSLLWRRA